MTTDGEHALDRLIQTARNIAAGNLAEVDKLLAMAGDPDLPPEIAALAEAFGMLAVQIEARDYHIELEVERANYDAVTRLPNRAMFGQQLQRALDTARQQERQLALLFVDLDRFKLVNDTLGHAAGDQLLGQVAARMLHCMRAGDVVARLGGDEFTILLPTVRGEKDAREVAQRLISSLSAPFQLDAGEVQIGASIGIALFPVHATDADRLMGLADAAMYRAKQLGRNNFQLVSTGPSVNEPRPLGRGGVDAA